MRRWRQWLYGGVLVFAIVSLPGGAFAASEMDILLDKLVEKGILTNVEAGLVRREVQETKEERNKQLAKEIVPDSARNWKWKGDIRLRDEFRNRIGSGTDINRTRIRFRYGFEAKVNDELKVGARIATGSTTDPVSTNQSLNTAFNHKNFLLDRAFAEYTPAIPGITKLKVTGGVIENPFWIVGPLVWDDDLNFDGVAAHLEQEIGPVTVFTNDGLFSLQTDVTEAATLWSAQAGAIVKLVPDSEEEVLKNLKFTSAVSYHDYQNVTNPFSENNAFALAGGSTAGAGTGAPSTAQLKGNSAFVNDFNLINPTVELSSQYRDVPFSLFGDWIHNTEVQNGLSNGSQIGLKVGKARIPFDVLKGWEAGYFFERLEPDATFGPFTDSDFGNGGTNHRGHVWWFKLAMLKNSTLGFKYFNTQEVKGSKANADTLQLDWVTAF